jgi:uncharacterized integral membrane protein (TIGR00698 family)
MKRETWMWAGVGLFGVALVCFGAPSWLALGAGLAVALSSGKNPPPAIRALTSRTLQLGVVALGAGMNLEVVWRIGSSGALITAISLTAALTLGFALGRWLRVPGETPLLISVGTAICGGSAIAAIASVVKPEEHELSVSLAVVFVLNAVGLVLFPVLGHAMGLSQPAFGRWAALAIHDTSSVVGAGMAFGPVALAIATTTKLARALWIVPVAFAVAIGRQRRAGASLRDVRWPWFILAFVAMAAVFTWIPELAPLSHPIVVIGQRALVLALFLIGLSLSRRAVANVGIRPLLLGVTLWVVVAAVSLPLAIEAAS